MHDYFHIARLMCFRFRVMEKEGDGLSKIERESR